MAYCNPACPKNPGGNIAIAIAILNRVSTETVSSFAFPGLHFRFYITGAGFGGLVRFFGSHIAAHKSRTVATLPKRVNWVE
jgi:hypothetical protein